jgi:hypothetical protein
MAGAARLATISVARRAIRIIVLVELISLVELIIFVYLSLGWFTKVNNGAPLPKSHQLIEGL